MRSVLLVTRHTDVTDMVPALAQASLEITVRPPEKLPAATANSNSDVLALDLRDIPPAAFELLADDAEERGVVLIALLRPEHLDRISVSMSLDDFVVLPVEPAELARRIERALWRRHGIDSENFVRCGALALDLSNYRVTVDGEPLVMTFKEYELLRFLAMNAGRVFTREQLLNRVWGYDYFGGSRTVDVHIRRIRQKIEVRGHAFIETVRNVGYRLVAEARAEGVDA